MWRKCDKCWWIDENVWIYVSELKMYNTIETPLSILYTIIIDVYDEWKIKLYYVTKAFYFSCIKIRSHTHMWNIMCNRCVSYDEWGQVTCGVCE